MRGYGKPVRPKMLTEALSSLIEEERVWWRMRDVHNLLITFVSFIHIFVLIDIFSHYAKKDGVLASSRPSSAQPPLVTGLLGLCRTRLFAL
jgi:hypothetical protein